VLRLHPYEYHRPGTVQEAIALLAEHAGDAIPIAGGTDLVPNMKHGLFTPGHLVSLRGIDGMRGIAEDAGGFTIGAATTLDSVARNEAVLEALPSLARACALVSGPQLRRMGTIGGNVCLDTRCTYYNQTLFWRKALGYCLKKDGDACHVVKGGTRCVAAHSADAATALLPLEAELRIAGPDGERTTPINGFFTSDGVWNRRMEPGELLVSIRVPRPAAGTRHGFQKLRARDSIDFPMLNLAVRVDLSEEKTVAGIQMAASGMGSYPRKIGKLEAIAQGRPLAGEVVEEIALQAFRQCHPLDNIPVDAEWRRAMVPVLVRRALAEIGA
jgi:4-hydroxybenzoyl-CoA reductase subunit beta